MSLDIRTYASVWDAVADDAGEAANLKLRSQLMDILDAYIDREAITQEEASRRFGVPRSRVSELVNGRISKFSIDKLVNMAARVGLVTRISVAQEVRPLDDATAAAAPGVTGNDPSPTREITARHGQFTLIVAVDWSARSRLGPRAETGDSVWLAWMRIGSEPCARYFRTRSDAVTCLETLLEETEGSALVTFDFPFGYPDGCGLLAKRELYADMARRISDGDDNANNRFEVAAALNAELNDGRPGPFWGCPANHQRPTLTAKGSLRRGGPFREHRIAEQRLVGRGIQTCWKLYTAGSVGSQMLLGLPVLHRVLQRPDARLWPFETGWDQDLGGTVLAEIWPSLFPIDYNAHRIKDACQVLASVRWMAERGPDVLTRPASISRDEEVKVMAGEGWIVGLDVGLNQSARPSPPGVRRDPQLAS